MVTSLNKFTVTLLHASLAVGAVKLGVPVHSTVALDPAAPIVGGVVSVTVIVCDTVDDVLPHASTAFQVLVIVFTQELPLLTSPPTCCTVTLLHASLAVGAVNDGDAVHSIVAFAPAAPITGGVVSVTVIVCDTVDEVLPHASTAFHVLVIVFTQLLPLDTSPPTCCTVTLLHASLAVGAVNDGEAVHSIVALAPAAPITGGVVSVTVIVCDTVDEVLPHASTAFHVLVIVFTQLLPLDTSTPTCCTVTLLHASLAVGAVNDGGAVHSIVAFAPAAPIVGGVVSVTVIVCDTVDEVLPHASTAFHVLVIVFKQLLPLDTSPPTCCTVTLLHASLAVGAVNDGEAVHSIVALAPAAPITGGVVSVTVIVCDTVDEVLPHASTAFHVLVIVFTQLLPLDTSPPTCCTVTLLHASLAVGAVNDGDAVHSIVAFAPAAPITGGVVSVTVIVCDTVDDVLPHASTAFHVLVIVFIQLLPLDTSLPTCCTVTLLHASLAVGAVNDGDAVHSIVALAPAAPIVGGVVSVTVIVCDTVDDVLPHASTAFHVLVIVFTQLLPLDTSTPTCCTVTLLHASLAVGAVNDGEAVHSIVAFAPAAPIVGGVVSVTVIVCDTVDDVLPHASTAFHVLVIVFTKLLPLDTSLPTCCTVTLLHASLAVGAVNDGEAVHSIVAFAP